MSIFKGDIEPGFTHAINTCSVPVVLGPRVHTLDTIVDAESITWSWDARAVGAEHDGTVILRCDVVAVVDQNNDKVCKSLVVRQEKKTVITAVK